MATKKKVEVETPEVKEIKPEKVKVIAKFDFKFGGKLYKKGETLKVYDGDAKRLTEKGFASLEK